MEHGPGPGRREDLTTFEVLYVLWGRKKLVGFVVAIMVCASLVYGLTIERMYVAESFISVAPSNQNLTQFEREALVRETVDPSVTGYAVDATIAELRWSAGAGDFRNRLQLEYVVREDGPTGVLVGFSGRTSEEAANVANTYAELLAGWIERSEGQGVGGEQPSIQVEVVTRAEPSELWVSVGFLRYLVVAVLVGIVLGGALALLFEGRARTWRDAHDAEMTLHAPVLGVIPDYPSLVGENSGERSTERGRR